MAVFAKAVAVKIWQVPEVWSPHLCTSSCRHLESFVAVPVNIAAKMAKAGVGPITY